MSENCVCEWDGGFCYNPETKQTVCALCMLPPKPVENPHFGPRLNFGESLKRRQAKRAEEKRD